MVLMSTTGQCGNRNALPHTFMLQNERAHAHLFVLDFKVMFIERRIDEWGVKQRVTRLTSHNDFNTEEVTEWTTGHLVSSLVHLHFR